MKTKKRPNLLQILAIIFLPAGGALLAITLKRAGGQFDPVAGVEIAFAAIILVLGIVFAVAGVITSAREADKDIVEAQFPGEPWRWEKRWRTGVVLPDPRWHYLLLLAGGFSTILVVAGAFIQGRSRPEFQKELPVILGMLAIALGLIAWNGYKFLVRFRHRSTRFEMKTFPGVIGGTLEGVIFLPRQLRLERLAVFHLKCLKVKYQTNHKGHRSRYEELIWEKERRINPALLPGDIAVEGLPVYFAIPTDCPASAEYLGTSGVIWRLHINAPVTGLDFAAEFTIPVFGPPCIQPAVPGPDLLLGAELQR